MTPDEALRWTQENEATVLNWKGRVEVLAHYSRGVGAGLVEAVEKIKAVIEKRKENRNGTRHATISNRLNRAERL